MEISKSTTQATDPASSGAALSAANQAGSSPGPSRLPESQISARRSHLPTSADRAPRGALPKIDYTHQGDNDFDNQSFSQSLEKAVELATKFNRIDVLKKINDIVKEHDANIDLLPGGEKDALNRIFFAGTTKHEEDAVIRNGNLLEHHPKPPGGALPLHKKSLSAFLRADSGHAFSGLVHIRNDGSQKIFLAALMPSMGTGGDPTKIYAPKLPDSNLEYGIYEKRQINFPPIEHFRLKDGVPQPSHKQFVEQIQKKYAEDGTTSGKYVGFSVIKGKLSDGLNNKCEFVSRTVNESTFRSGDETAGDRVVPPEWQCALKRTFDQLSIIEYAVDKSQSP